MTVSVVRSEIVVTERSGRRVHRGIARGIEETAVADDLDGLGFVKRLGRGVREARRRARIDGRPRCGAARDGEGTHVSPMRADGLLNAVRQ